MKTEYSFGSSHGLTHSHNQQARANSKLIQVRSCICFGEFFQYMRLPNILRCAKNHLFL